MIVYRRSLYMALAGTWLLGSVGASVAQLHRKCPNDGPWFGKVQIHTFGFEFVIPKGLKGYWNSPSCSGEGGEGCVCMGDHGRIVPLRTKNDRTDRQIEMYADNGAELDEDWTLTNAVQHASDTSSEQDIAGKRVIESRRMRLDGLSARRVVFAYIDKKSGRAMVEDLVVSLDKRRATMYFPYLRTPRADYVKDKFVFNAMLRSFRRISGEYGPR